MTEQELDLYLREPTELEEFFRDPGIIEKDMDMEHVQTLFLNQSRKMPPITIKDSMEFQSNRIRPDFFDEDRMMCLGQDIAFYMHPRYNYTGEHRHSFIELIYVYSGECNQTINNKRISMRKGELCILDTNTYHSIEKSDDNDIIINCLMRKKYFNAAFLSRLSGNDLITDFIVHAIYQSKDFNEFILLHSDENEKIGQLMRNILCEYYDRSMCSEEVINSYMIILFAEMLRVYKNDVNSQNYAALKNTRVSDILHYVKTNFKTATLESIAKHFNFDPGYLSKALKKLTGNKFIDLVHQARLGQACILLKSTDVPVSVIANEVGYENINFFYQLFKRHYNCSPAEYRKSSLYKEVIP